MAGEDPIYIEKIHRLPCCAAGMGGPPCNGPIEAHHRNTGRIERAVTKGADRRAHDHDAIPLCKFHHTAWHAASQPFKILVKAERRAWEDEQVFRTQKILQAAASLTSKETDHEEIRTIPRAIESHRGRRRRRRPALCQRMGRAAG